jgi:hypothetical protein
MKMRMAATRAPILPHPDSHVRRRRRPVGVVPCVVVFALVCGSVAAQTGGPDRPFNEVLAADLVQTARERLNEGDTEAARFLLQRAYGVDPSSGDAVYLLSTYVDERRRCVLHREAMLRYALAVGLETIARDVPAGDLARILIDTDRSSEAVGFLDTFLLEEAEDGAVHSAMQAVRRQDEGVPQPADHLSPPPLELLFMEAQLRADPSWFTTGVLERMRYRYPEDPTLTYLDMSRRRSLSPSFLEWVDASLLAMAPGRSDAGFVDILGHLLDTLLGGSREQFPEELRDHLTAQYYLRGGRDPVPAVELLLERGESAPPVVSAFLHGAAWVGEKRVWEVLARYREQTDRPEPLPEPFDSGVRELVDADRLSIYLDDGSGSGYHIYTFEQGVLRRWQHDESGNGLYNRVAEIDGTTIILTERSGNTIVRTEFSRYPMVTRAWSLQTRIQSEDADRSLSCAMEEELEVIAPEGSRRWTPPRPVPFDPGLRVQPVSAEAIVAERFTGDELFQLWDVLGGRVTFETGIQSRFRRQFGSDDARGISRVEAEAMTDLLRALDVIR